MNAASHDAYAADYDRQVLEYGSHVHEALFGLCYQFARPGQRLLDVGIGTGLAAELFARLGLQVDGLDFSPEMLAQCRAKGFAAALICHDVTQTPWPVDAGAYDHVISCGVFHFIGALDAIFAEAGRALKPGGVCAFTAKIPAAALEPHAAYQRQEMDAMEIFSHAPEYIAGLLNRTGFAPLKRLRCFVGEDGFEVWVARKNAGN